MHVAKNNFKYEYLQMFKSFNFLFMITHFDFTHAVLIIKRYNVNLNQSHKNAIMHIYSYLINTQSHNLNYIKENHKLLNYMNSDYNDCLNIRKSITN